MLYLKVLVTGATGKLGSALLTQLKASDYTVRTTSRKKTEEIGEFEWVYSDLLSGEGLEAAVKDVDVIIHAATSPMKDSKNIEVTGFENLLSKAWHIKHFIYPSIVGIEDIPFKYYKLKYEAEELLRNGSVPYTIARATQFHSFIENLFLSKPLLKKYVIPGHIKFQSVDVEDFAKYLIEQIKAGPQGRANDFGGPDIMTLKEMAELKIKVNNEARKVVSISLPGKLYKSLLEGKNTSPAQKTGEITFEEYLIGKMN
ncbi:SDR family oxidoreductase [Solibacillus silvestris]|uniref:SDR family oxidoreductase n=1 Tax=Solibacillus silvestris TaxID=76853 RepID=UPI003F7D64AF